jgi:hypothetical protein
MVATDWLIAPTPQLWTWWIVAVVVGVYTASALALMLLDWLKDRRLQKGKRKDPARKRSGPGGSTSELPHAA